MNARNLFTRILSVVVALFMGASVLVPASAQSATLILIERGGDVIVVNTSDGSETNLTRQSRVEWDGSSVPTRIMIQPRWSPDGGFISMILTNPPAPMASVLASGDAVVFDRMGRLLSYPAICTSATLDCVAPYVGPTGQWVVMTVVDVAGNFSLYAVNTATKTETKIMSGGFDPAAQMGFRDPTTFVVVGVSTKHVINLTASTTTDESFVPPTTGPAVTLTSCNNEVAVQSGPDVILSVNGAQTGKVSGNLPAYPGFQSPFACSKLVAAPAAPTATPSFTNTPVPPTATPIPPTATPSN